MTFGLVESPAWGRAAWWVRAGYLWHFAAIAAFLPFATIYYRDLGFSGLQVGVLAALPALAAAFGAPALAAMADSLAIHRLVLRAGLALAAVLALTVTQTSSFGPILLLIGLLALATAPIAPLLDGYGVTIAERRGVSYGSLRVWGSLGYMAAVLVVGRLMGDQVSALFLVAYAACLGLGLVSVLGLPPLTERSARPLFTGLGLLLRNRPLAALLVTAYLISSSAAVMNNFLGIHVQALGGTASLVGLAFALSAASELPVVAGGGWFLARFGASRLITIAIIAYAVRFLAFGTIPTAAWVLPVQALHGLSFGAFLLASVTLAHRLGGREYAATAQGLLVAVSFGFGSITGSLLAGALLDRVGTVGLFRGAAVAMLLTLGVFILGGRAAGLTAPKRESNSD